jgi:adenylate cyclase
MQRSAKALAIGLGTGALGALLVLTPLGLAFEERFGLGWLFWVRGPEAPSAEVVVVSYDRDSSERLGLPDKIRDWPRTVHAEVTDRLASAGASVIAFDVIFERPKSEAEDQAFARAIARSGHVLLYEYLDRTLRPISGGQQAIAGILETEQLRPPLPQLAASAAGLAPFPLPKVPDRVSQFWAFKAGVDERPTLPAVALQRHAMDVHERWVQLLDLAGVGDDLETDPAALADADSLRVYMNRLRARFVADPTLEKRLIERLDNLSEADPQNRLLAALVRLYSGSDSRYLNFYGPPGQVTTIPLHRLLGDSNPLPDVQGRVVFVGQSDLMNLHEDMFPTVYSRADGVDLAGVEIAATAFANLLDGHLLEPLEPPLAALLLVAFGLAVGLVGGLLPALIAVPVALLTAGTYYAGAQFAFGRAGLWLPVALPMLVQLPLGLFTGLLVQYREARRMQANVTRGLRYYVPEKLAHGFAAAARVDPATMREQLFAACMVSDASRFTSLAEGMAPRELTMLLDSYFAILFGAVERHGGVVTDVVGDGMTCIWTAPAPDTDLRARAVRAALEIDLAIAEFNQRIQPHELPTRFGLHCGPVMVGNVGGSGHFVYSVVGDCVNTTARLESLNKQLGTRLLGSAEMLDGLDGLRLRPLGRFRLVGKQEVLALLEVLNDPDAAEIEPALPAFADALAHFQEQRFAEAMKDLEVVLTIRPQDGPAAFYLDRCRYHLAGPSPEEPGVVWLVQK